MDVVNFLVTNYICCASLFALASLICYILRNQFGEVVVNCWFCDTDSTVRRKEKNSWTCHNCQQYNGFKKNGDYNEHLPAMHDEKLNAKQVALSCSSPSTAYIPQQVQLCSRCSRNQLLKVKQLSQFKPFNEDDFESEVNEYKKKLDKLYKLCARCKDILCRHIKMQDTIIRGKIMYKKQRDKVAQFSQTSIVTNTVVNWKSGDNGNVLAIICRFVVMLLSYLNLFHFVCTSHSYVYWSYVPCYFGNLYKDDILGFIVVSGLTLSVAATTVQNTQRKMSPVLSILLWMICVAFAYANKCCDNKENDFTTQLIAFYSNDFDKARMVEKPLKKIIILSNISAYFVLDCVRGLVCLSLICLSSKNLYQTATLRSTGLSALIQYSPSKQNQERAKPVLSGSPSHLNTSMYSDCSMPSDEEQNSETTCLAAEKEMNSHQELNGSLNALKLQDGVSNFSSFKHPNALFTDDNLTSTLPTPPPSRSSSLLSLSSYQSLPSHNSINKFGSTIAFAKPTTESFYRYKVKSAVGSDYMVRQSPTISAASKSVASDSTMKFRNSSLLGNRSNFRKGSTVGKRPLIIPAKLRLRKSDKTGFDYGSGDNTDSLLLYGSGSSEKTPEVSINDSASQVGTRPGLDFSDDDDIQQTPHRPPNLNSSSPKSTISSITTATLESVKTVENSRMCRWILAACLLLNLVLVVLLVAEVREMREKEQWKSRSYL